MTPIMPHTLHIHPKPFHSFAHSTVLAVIASLPLVGCVAMDDGEVTNDEQGLHQGSCEGSKCDTSSALGPFVLGRTTEEFCNAVERRWGEHWELPDATGEKQRHVTDAMACANRRYWATRYNPIAVHNKFYIHQQICEQNPASHYAMNSEQRDFYCAISLHFRMCNTQGLYAIKDYPDSIPRRERDNDVFAACLQLSGELEHFRSALQLEHLDDEEVAEVVERLYDEYRVQPGIRVPPAIVNPDRASKSLFERIARIAYYGITVPIEMVETTFSNLFLSLDPKERESQIKLILFYRKNLEDWGGANLLDPSELPICGDGYVEAGEECDDGNTQSGDGCTSYCALE